MARASLCWEVPLRYFTAQIVIPQDLTQKEADRLRAMIDTVPNEAQRGEGE